MAESQSLKTEKQRKNFITLNKVKKNSVYVKRKGYSGKNEEKTIRHLSLSANIIGALCFVLFIFCIVIFFAEVFVPMVSGESSGKVNTNLVITDPEEEEATIESLMGVIAYDNETGIPIYNDSFNLHLINKSNPVDENYTVETEEVAGVLVDKRISTSLRVMLAAARADNIEIKLVSGYLTYEQQAERFEIKKKELIENKESTLVMAEFKTGRAVGIPLKCDEGSGMCVTVDFAGEDFTETDVYKWLNNNAADYGFVFRFPKGKTDLTGRAYDPTVLRFVGKENAYRMRQLSFCLEEFVRYKNQTK